MPPRALRPNPHLEPGPSAAGSAPVRDPPQPAPAAPLPQRSRAAETATRTGRPQPVPRTKTGSHRWHDQRIPPGRVTWTRFSARTGQLGPLVLAQPPTAALAAPAVQPHPVAQGALVDPQPPGHLRDRLPGLPDQPHRALLEVLVELPACLCHRPPPLRRCVHATRGNPRIATCFAGWRRGMIVAVGPAEGPEATSGRVARPGAGGVVSRLALIERLGAAARMTVVSGPPGSGKTVLLRSWVGEAGLTERAAWVSAGRKERDPQRFWLSVLGALRETAPGSALVRPLTAAPGLDGWAIAERLLADLAPLADRIWLVIDDVHELGPDTLRQLELLVMRAPPGLRLVLVTRQDLRLGLHRLRLEGELTEIRERDLRFTVAEARALFAAAGVQLPDAALVSLHERTEGWAAGLRLAALSLAGHEDPARFAAGFSGTERTVAEYR